MSSSVAQPDLPDVPPGSGGMIDPDAVMRIRSMELRAKVIVEGFFKGIHRSPYHGFSVEFTEYRQYTPGDDTRYIDWRLFARSDRYYIKKFEDETNLRCHLLVDHSRSMSYSSGEYSKSQYAGTLAATLAYFLSTQGDAVGLATLSEAIDQYLPARNRPGHLRRLMLALEKPAQGRATEFGAPLKRMAEMLTKRGLLVLISDLLAPIDHLERHLDYLRSRGHEIVLFHILDPAELNFDFELPALFRDIETGRDLYIDPATARKQYKRRLSEHLSKAQNACRNLGIDYHLFSTDRPFELALLDFLNDRMRRGKHTRRFHRNPTRSSA